MLLARWTLEDRCLKARAALQVISAAGIFLFLPPEIVFALRGGRWSEIALHGWRLGLALQLIALLALPGTSAVQEFVARGGGTPIPCDPPKRLVTSGIYRYVANPMQLSCTLVMLASGMLLRNRWLVCAGLISFLYSAGIAKWDEGEDLKLRFGQSWVEYRSEVRDWHARWRPFAPAPPARLYVARQCGICSELRRWFEAHRPLGLELLAAEDCPNGTLRRMRYQPAAGEPAEDGLRAFARGLEHLHLGWALLGMGMRLPGLRWALQSVADGVGFGERLSGLSHRVVEQRVQRDSAKNQAG
jgi:protein-S-isoprenylcysteine O-methyltransferase Ste14